MWRNLVGGLQALKDGRSADADRQFKAANRICAQRGDKYFPVAEVAELSLADVLKRVEAATQAMGQVDANVAAASWERLRIHSYYCRSWWGKLN